MHPNIIVIESDVPEGMTLREWRRTRTPARKSPPLVRLVRHMHRARSRAARAPSNARRIARG
jgi:hypothetical protein